MRTAFALACIAALGSATGVMDAEAPPSTVDVSSCIDLYYFSIFTNINSVDSNMQISKQIWLHVAL